jgi:hypothetical protein
MMNRKDTDLSFLAGLFDIRGCIKIEAPKKTEALSLYIWVTSKSFKLMEFLQTFGAKVGQRPDKQYKAKWKDRAAYSVLRMVLPYLIVKKDQAEVGVEFYNDKSKGCNPATHLIPQMLRLRLMRRHEEAD